MEAFFSLRIAGGRGSELRLRATLFLAERSSFLGCGFIDQRRFFFTGDACG